MKLILQVFYPNSTQNATFNDFNEFTAVSEMVYFANNPIVQWG